jgi:hypothetical protein
MASPTPEFDDAVKDAEGRTGRGMVRILTPGFDIAPGGPAGIEPERVLDECRALNATFCLPHQGVTDRLIGRMTDRIRDWDRYGRLIRERGMIPGLSTHMPEAVVIADKTGADVETYIQIYNAAGFLMQVEADWVMRVIRNAKKPVMAIKPLAAGRLLPPVGLAFVWNTIRDQDIEGRQGAAPARRLTPDRRRGTRGQAGISERTGARGWEEQLTFNWALRPEMSGTCGRRFLSTYYRYTSRRWATLTMVTVAAASSTS